MGCLAYLSRGGTWDMTRVGLSWLSCLEAYRKGFCEDGVQGTHQSILKHWGFYQITPRDSSTATSKL